MFLIDLVDAASDETSFAERKLFERETDNNYEEEAIMIQLASYHLIKIFLNNGEVIPGEWVNTNAAMSKMTEYIQIIKRNQVIISLIDNYVFYLSIYLSIHLSIF